MEFVWEPWALLGFASGALSWSLAAVIYGTRPDRPQNRLLALFLALAGSAWFLSSGFQQVQADARWAYAALVTAFAAHVASHCVHLLFLSTLPSPMVRPLRHPAVRIALVAVFALWVTHIVARPLLWDRGVLAGDVVAWVNAAGPLYARFWWLFDVMWWFGFLVAVTAYRNRAAWTDRRQARAYVLAFAVHDGGFGLLLAALIWFPPSSAALAEWLSLYPWPLFNIWLAILLAYAILRTQLFEIDLKVKVAIRRSTVAAAFAGAFLIASEGLEAFVPFDGVWLGVGAAIGIGVALRSIRRIAERVADRLLPGVAATPEYVDARKHEVFRATLAGAAGDGVITEKERHVLEVLRREFGISEAAAAAMEREVLGALGPKRS